MESLRATIACSSVKGTLHGMSQPEKTLQPACQEGRIPLSPPRPPLILAALHDNNRRDDHSSTHDLPCRKRLSQHQPPQ